MKIVITGSLGHIGKPLTQSLIASGNSVTVISSNENRKSEIENLGAIPAIGSIEDIEFLKSIFKDADSVFCMVPPADYNEPDRRIFYSRIANNYCKAIKNSTIKNLILR